MARLYITESNKYLGETMPGPSTARLAVVQGKGMYIRHWFWCIYWPPMPLTYKSHTIVAGASRSQISGRYIPVVYIAWEIADRRGHHSIISRERFATFEEAGGFAAIEAKAWVDRHAVELD